MGGGGICNSHLLRRREVSMRCGYSNNSSFLFGGIGRVWVGIGKWGRGIGGKQSACRGTTEGKGNDIRQNGRLRQWSRVRLSPAFPQDIGFGCDLFSFYNVVSLRSSVHTLATQGGCWCCWCCVPDCVNPPHVVRGRASHLLPLVPNETLQWKKAGARRDREKETAPAKANGDWGNYRVDKWTVVRQ